MAWSRAQIDEAHDRIDRADKSTDFATLARGVAGLDPTRHFRFADWSDVSFRDSVLRDFDFAAARLHNCDFTGAKIAGACFAQAELGAVLLRGRDNAREPARMTGIANLHSAADWDEYVALITDSDRSKTPADLHDTSHLPDGAIFSDAPGLAPEMVVVPAGAFLMGSPDGRSGEPAEEGRASDEGPLQEICFDRRFAIGRFAVTVAEFELFSSLENRRRAGRIQQRNRRDDMLPIVNVSWYGAADYCKWLNAMLGLPADTYRLPSESEWEYAARAGTDGPYWWDGAISPQRANFAGEGVVSVRTYEPNPWGLYQVHGNVWEWCQDTYMDTLEGIPLDGESREPGGDGRSRVFRGGSWSSIPRSLRAAGRSGYAAFVRNNVLGFRVGRTLTS
jgi:formylglycine-generating enzyme required for sulfatase activity